MLRDERPIPVRLALLTAVLGTTLVAQDPSAPPGGFAIKPVLDQPITYSDGYRTLLDIRYPDQVTPPATGWPCAMVVHGGDNDRRVGWLVSLAEQLTRAGYVTLAYDTGNQGVTTRLNPGVQRTEAERIRDLAEIFRFAELQLGNVMDDARLAVAGRSDGGKHALWAASYSGLPLPVASALVTRMPPIRAIHSDIQVLDPPADFLPEGNTIRTDWAVKVIAASSPGDPLAGMLLNNDYAGLRAVLLADPGKAFFGLLQQSDVPLMLSYAFDDKKHDPRVNPDSMRSLKPGVPRRYLQDTGGHGSIQNDVEDALRWDFTRRWFDRFLKGIANQVEQEPLAEIALLESDPQLYQNAKHPWRHRRTATWPIAPSTRLYLRGGGVLATSAPAAAEAGPTIRHRITPGYDMLAFVADDGSPPAVLASIPLVTATFDAPPATEARELFGRAVVELDVVNALSPDFQLHAALLDVPPTGAPRYVTSAVSARRNAAPGRHRFRIELADVGYVLQPGHRLRLSLENLSLRRQPGSNWNFKVVPDFADCDIAVQIDPTFAPRIELPIGSALPSLLPRFGGVRATNGFAYDLALVGESSRAGEIYAILVGATGTTPGFTLPPHVPLNIDLLTIMALDAANTPAFPGFVGTLDALGRAKATVALPAAVASLGVGWRLAFAAATLGPSRSWAATNPVELVLEK